MTTFRVLVCGGRTYSNAVLVFKVLDGYLAVALREQHKLQIAQGGASGADELARDWAEANGVECLTFDAAWKKHGLRAGPIRNALMLEDFNPSVVVAFPGGKGTADMIDKTRKAGLPLYQPVPTPEKGGAK